MYNDNRKNIQNSKYTKIQFRNITDDNVIHFKRELNEVNWNLDNASNNADIAYSNFITIFNALYNKHFP